MDRVYRFVRTRAEVTDGKTSGRIVKRVQQKKKCVKGAGRGQEVHSARYVDS